MDGPASGWEIPPQGQDVRVRVGGGGRGEGRGERMFITLRRKVILAVEDDSGGGAMVVLQDPVQNRTRLVTTRYRVRKFATLGSLEHKVHHSVGAYSRHMHMSLRRPFEHCRDLRREYPLCMSCSRIRTGTSLPYSGVKKIFLE